MDRKDRFRGRLDLDRAAVSAKAYRVANVVSVDAERDDRPAAHEGASCRQVSAPPIVCEILIRRDDDVGSIKPYCDITGHLVGAADERQTIATVELAVILCMVVHPRRGARPHARNSTPSTRPVAMSAAGSPFGLGRCGRITVPPWAWQRSAQSDNVTSSEPPISASSRSVRTPGHDGFLQAKQCQVSEQVLAILLRGVDNRAAVARNGGTSDKLLGVREQMAPLREQEVDDVEILAPRLGVAALGREEMDVRVAAEPALGVQVGPPLEA